MGVSPFDDRFEAVDILLGCRFVLTADHCANGSSHVALGHDETFADIQGDGPRLFAVRP